MADTIERKLWALDAAGKGEVKLSARITSTGLIERSSELPIARPVVKSAGGKRRLLPEILGVFDRHVKSPPDANTGTFHEPFAGGASVALEVMRRYVFGKIRIADNNLALIATYKVIRDDVEALIRVLDDSYPSDWINRLDRFVALRAEFNSMMQYPHSGRAIGLAARFIVLNKTAFNGIWRVNSSGQFNVPFAHYNNPTICDVDNLRACSRALQGAKLYAKDFGSTPVKHGDVVYCDPPYIPTNATSNFVGYTKEGFGTDDQVRLRDKVREWKKLGAFVLLSNSDTPMTRELYKGFTLKKVQAARSVNARGDGRGKVSELLIY